MVRCKMIVTQKKDVFNSWQKQRQSVVCLTAATGDDNKSWAKYTPNGSIELTIDNPDAVDAFKLGEFYFVDFHTAPATEREEGQPPAQILTV